MRDLGFPLRLVLWLYLWLYLASFFHRLKHSAVLVCARIVKGHCCFGYDPAHDPVVVTVQE